MRRTARGLLVLVAAVLVTTACTPKVVGTSGVTRTAGGDLVFLSEPCSDEEVENAWVSDVSVFSQGSRLAAHAETEAEEDEAEDLMARARVVSWSGEGTSGSLTVQLRGEVEGAGWTLDDVGRELRPGVRYAFGASSEKGWAVRDEVEFTLADVEALAPGEVRNARGETLPDEVTFRAIACG